MSEGLGWATDAPAGPFDVARGPFDVARCDARSVWTGCDR
ncbi:hypothetical protein QFZ29_002000 [Agromyces albus]|nr:hypothetical protein [Agromyces albus]